MSSYKCARHLAIASAILILTMQSTLASDDAPVTPETCSDKNVDKTNAALVAEGRRLFKEETFQGNGRTCETCHRENKNFTIDTDIIAQLPASDPLFVNETNPKLVDLENSEMLRKFGLICENLDGFDKPCVFRSVMHTLGLSQTTGGTNDPSSGVPGNVVHETGWSGDGAPGDGSLRCFALGAIIQHFPKTLDRVRPDQVTQGMTADFRFPTEHELDALLAFQLASGRQATLNLNSITFLNSFAEYGRDVTANAKILTRKGVRQLELNPAEAKPDKRRCGGCHNNAGSDTEIQFTNRNRVTNVSFAPTSAACRGLSLETPLEVSGDGGFGRGPDNAYGSSTFSGDVACANGTTLRASFIGDLVYGPVNGVNMPIQGYFNPQSLYEAADTAPYFHNNSFDTLEDAIRFYGSDAFDASAGNEGRAFAFGPADVNNIGGFLRALNAAENARSAITYIDKAIAPNLGEREAKEMVKLAIADTMDGIKVLNTGPLSKPPTTPNRKGAFYPDAIQTLMQARDILHTAMTNKDKGSNSLSAPLNQARALLAKIEGKIYRHN